MNGDSESRTETRRTTAAGAPPAGPKGGDAGPRTSTSPTGGRLASRAARWLAVALVALLGAGACISVSRQDEIEMGRDFRNRINQQLPLIDDPVIREPISEAGHRLARVSPRPDLPYEFYVVNTNVINAFAVPGGFVYMNRGLIEESDEMSEVAGVLAHEVAHVVARHSAEQIERQRTMGLGLALGSVIFGAPSGLARLGVNVGANLFFAKHSREAEAEADSIGVRLMMDAGWHPCGMVEFFRTMLSLREDKPGALESLFASHPLTESRIRNTERLISQLPRDRMEGLRETTPNYDRLLRALRDFPPPPPRFRVDEQRKPEQEPPRDPAGEAPADSIRACPVEEG